MPQSQSIIVWLIRDFSKASSESDAKLTVAHTRAGYTATYQDRMLDTNDTITFADIKDVKSYLDLFFLNLAKDRDVTNNFESIQYIIPGFPSIVQNVSDFNSAESYDLFMDTIHFYMDHSL